jgi:hypothetical protein
VLTIVCLAVTQVSDVAKVLKVKTSFKCNVEFYFFVELSSFCNLLMKT